MANEPDVLIYDPDIGPMVAVTLPATSIVLDGVPVVCDIDRELLIVPSGTQPAHTRQKTSTRRRGPGIGGGTPLEGIPTPDNLYPPRVAILRRRRPLRPARSWQDGADSASKAIVNEDAGIVLSTDAPLLRYPRSEK